MVNVGFFLTPLLKMGEEQTASLHRFLFSKLQFPQLKINLMMKEATLTYCGLGFGKH